MGDGAALLDSLDDEQESLTISQKVHLSYWIYKHDHEGKALVSHV